MQAVERDRPEPPLSLTEALQGKSRTSVAHEAHARAVETVTELGASLRAAFDDLMRAEEQLRTVGVSAEATFGDPVQVAWDSYRRLTLQKEDVRKEMEARRS